MSKRRASRAKRGEWCMTMLRKMFTRCPNRLPMLALARICLLQLASVCTRLPMFINARACLPILACDCTRFAFICPRLPMPANAWTCYPALDKLIILNALPVPMLRQVPKNTDSVREVLTLWGSKLDLILHRFWDQFWIDFGSILDRFLDVLKEPKNVKISISPRRNAFCHRFSM